MQFLPKTTSSGFQNEIKRISRLFDDAGAGWVEAPTLLSAEVMLDLYGESIRDHAYIINDAVDGDFVLRPDFTVPLVEAHMNEGAEPARYAYFGRVWRRRENAQSKHSFYQMGYELFDRGDRARNDAEIFATAMDIASTHDFKVKTGDLGLIFSALDMFEIEPWRRAALKRHLWRPNAFLRLLDQYSNSKNKHDWLNDFDGLNPKTPDHGLRTKSMIEARIERLKLENKTPPLSKHMKELLLDIVAINGSLASTENDLAVISSRNELLTGLVDQFAARNAALSDSGIDPSQIQFDAGFGRESMEYYDGFVFGFYNQNGQVAISGGRYDSLTEILGQGHKIPAIGLACFPERFVEIAND